MANVIVAFWTENGRVMYDAISDNLHRNGNNVMYLDMHDFISFSAWGTTYTISQEDKEYLTKKISRFKPDLILSFNNIFPHEFVIKLGCPICVIDADTPNMGFWNRDILKENKDRYVFLGLQKASEQFYKDAFGEIKRYLFWPPATMMQNTHQEPNINISFIGSNFLSIPHFVYNYDYLSNKEVFDDIITAFDNMNGEFCNDFDTFKNKYFSGKDDAYTAKIFRFFYYHSLSGMERISYLSVLSDLGLKIYGLNTWRELLYFDIDLAKCFDDTNIATFKDNLLVYNRSKIAINISHKQAVSSFSWRVMDIMASNACLLMEDKPDWRDLFAKYLSPEVLDTIIYKDRFDMRQKAIKLLNDEELRKRCVAELNNAIEQNGRWEVRFKSLEKFLGIKLLKIKNAKPTYIKPRHQKPTKEITSPIQKTQKKKSTIAKLKIKKRSKLFFYSLLLLIAQVPVLDLFIRSKKRKKILRKINKWWR